MKECPSCGGQAPYSAARCKDCFHDFDESALAKKRRDGPIFLLAAVALMSILATGTLWYVTRAPIEERILVDKQTRSVIWTRVYQGNRLETERLLWNDVAKLQYITESTGFEIVAVSMNGDRHVIQESLTSLKKEADQYSRMMDKPLDIVDETGGFHKLD